MSNFNMEELMKKMAEFKNRTIYQELTMDILTSLPDDKLEQAIFDYANTKITDYKYAVKVVSKLSPAIQMVYSLRILDAEVRNGGFNQFFYNSSGRFTEMALASLKLLGASNYYDILENAIAIHIQETDANPKLKKLYSQRTLQAFSQTYKLSSLDKCDNEFYAQEKELYQLKLDYIHSHLDEFITA